MLRSEIKLQTSYYRCAVTLTTQASCWKSKKRLKPSKIRKANSIILKRSLSIS